MPIRTPQLRSFSAFAGVLAVVCACQAQTPVEDDLAAAYRALNGKDYDTAITAFRKGLAAHPTNAGAHKDLAYTLLKTGDNAEARDEFEAALKLNGTDETAALEFAFLAYETGRPSEARRTFNRLRLSKNERTRAQAETAYQNIDRPLVEGIERWTEALRRTDNPNSLPFYSAHWELAQLAEKRDEWTLASEQYGVCHTLKPRDGEVVLALARSWKRVDRGREANAALLAASRWRETRTAERARAEFGTRYPYPYEFLDALKFEPNNTPLRKELAYLLIAMHKEDEAAEQLQICLKIDGNDKEARDQLAALEAARTGLKLRPQIDVKPVAATPTPKEMGVKSLALGYMRDAICYLRQAHEIDPDDQEVWLKLGYAYNLAKDDATALQWFDRARHSDNGAMAEDARKAYRNLHGDSLPRTTVWTLPMFSSRWHDLFNYGQLKYTLPTPWSVPHHWFSLYLSTRFMGDVRSSLQRANVAPTYLSENSVIIGASISTKTWHHLTGWAEAGEAFNYLPFRHDIGSAIPDYRGGVNFGKGFGALLGSKKSGWFYETTADAVYVHRFDKDWLFNVQNRTGRTIHFGDWTGQALVNLNYLRDSKGEYWANTVEIGPGLKLRAPFMPQNVYFSADLLRGFYTNNLSNPRRPNYNDVRVGFWYALSK